MSQPYSLIVVPQIDAVNTAYTSPLDLSDYIDVSQGSGLDPADPNFSDKVFSHSLLKEGGTLALEDLKLKEMVFPLVLTAANHVAGAALVQSINSAINSAGAVVEWRDAGASQYTYFDLASGQIDPEYDYRRAHGNQWVLKGKLRLFVQPLGRGAATASPLLVASGTGFAVHGTVPLLTFVPRISLTPIGGDAPALLQAGINGAGSGVLPVSAISVLPDTAFVAMPQYVGGATSGYVIGSASGAVGGTFLSASSGSLVNAIAWPTPFDAAVAAGVTFAPARYAGQYRLLALARAQGATGSLSAITTGFGKTTTAVSVPVGDWKLLDLGVLSVAEGQNLTPPFTQLGLFIGAPSGASAVELTAVFVLPEWSTCFVKPDSSVVLWSGQPAFDGVFGYGAGQIYDAVYGSQLAPWARGTIPHLQPGGGNAIAFLNVPQGTTAPQNATWGATVGVLPRTRYVFP